MTEDLKYLEKQLAILVSEVEGEYRERRLASPEKSRAREKLILNLERKIGALKEEEFVEEMPLDIGPLGFDWFALSGFGMSTFLLCDFPSRSEAGQCIVFNFIGAMDSRMGGINDEVLEGHPLYGHGLAVCGFYEVVNSEWLRVTKQAMKLHPAYSDQVWRDMKHFLFRDKGGEFACLAKAFSYRVHPLSARKLYERLVEQFK